MKHLIQNIIKTAALSLGVVALAGPVYSQSVDYGAAAFLENCAVCHGPTGLGDGPVAELFAQRPKNLQTLAEDSGGVFPFSEVYTAISGVGKSKGHGTTEMPIWGDYFMAEALPKTFHPGIVAEEIVQARILGLVYYLQTIQK